MSRHTIQWTQSVEVIASVDVDVDELIAWAAETGAVRSLTGSSAEGASAPQMRMMLETNPHVQAALLRLWAIAHAN